MAVGDIRRSAGRMQGLPLAIADGLFFPLVIVGGLVAWFWSWLFADVIRAALIAGSRSAFYQILVNHSTGFTVVATCVTIAFLGTSIVRRAWLAGKSLASTPPGATSTRPSGMGPLKMLAILCGIIMAFMAVVYFTWLASAARGGPGAVVSRNPQAFPSGAHIIRENQSVMVTYGAGELHHLFYYVGNFSSSSSGSQNALSGNWTDEGSLKLKSGRTFGYRRIAMYPDELILNGARYDLQKGRVFVLHDDGTPDQLSIFVPLQLARDPVALGEFIGKREASE